MKKEQDLFLLMIRKFKKRDSREISPKDARSKTGNQVYIKGEKKNQKEEKDSEAERSEFYEYSTLTK